MSPDRNADLNADVSPDLRAALDDVSRIGPFFAVTANPAEVVDDSWRPLRELYRDTDVAMGPLAARIRQVAEALGVSDTTADRRVAASIAYQGLAARLVSPLLAAAAVHRVVPPWSPDTLHWRPAAVGPWPLWEAGATAWDRPERADLPRAVADVLLEPHLGALAAATRRVASVSAHTLWGNAASAVVAAGRLVAQARPAAADTAREIVAGLLAADPVAPAGTFGPGWAFRRRSCCLYYKVPGGGTCGDCVLTG